MNRLAGIGILSIALASAFVYGGYKIYQHHLSGDLKRLLIAANDPHDSFAELESYLHQMRPLVRTTRDRDLFDRFERGIFMVRDSQETSDRWFNESMNEIQGMRSDGGDACAQDLKQLQEVADRDHAQGRRVPPELSARLEQISIDVKTCRDRKQAELQQMERVSEDQLQEGKQLMAQVRRELDLPAIEEPRRASTFAQTAPSVESTEAAASLPMPTPLVQKENERTVAPSPAPPLARVSPPHLTEPTNTKARAAPPVHREPTSPPGSRPQIKAPLPAPTVKPVTAQEPGSTDFERARPRPSRSTGAADCPVIRTGDFEKNPAGWQFCVTNGTCLSPPDTRRCFQ